MARRAGRIPRGVHLVMGMALQMAASSPGRAEPAAACPVVRTPSDRALPFDADDLLRLIRLRLGDAPRCACPTVEVSPGEVPGVVVVTCPDRRAEVSVGERTGEAAAREVAIVLADIVLAPPSSSPPQPAPTLTAAPTAAALESRPAPPAAPARWSFWAAPGVAWSTSAGAAFEPHVGAGRALAGRFGLLVDVGFAEVSATTPKTAQALDVEMLPVRAGASLRLGAWRLSAGAAVRGFRANAGTTELGGRIGGFAAADWVFPRWSPLHPYVTAGLDLYAESLDVSINGISTLTGGHFAPWIALGVLWSRARP
jgi:hypothetical protein